MSRVTLRLPYPPTVNHLYRNTKRGRVKTERYKTWLNAAGWALREQKPRKIAGEYALWLYPQRPDNRRRDLGNLLKSIEDLLSACNVIEDDALASEIHLMWDGTGKECVVVVSEAAEKARRAA